MKVPAPEIGTFQSNLLQIDQDRFGKDERRRPESNDQSAYFPPTRTRESISLLTQSTKMISDFNCSVSPLLMRKIFFHVFIRPWNNLFCELALYLLNPVILFLLINYWELFTD